MSRAEFSTANRRNWDERVAIRGRDATGFYAVERFLAGEKRLHAIESGELGEVFGKRLIHLPCHFGLDTPILARQGAIATGVDFSAAAIAEARRLATEIGAAADFVSRRRLRRTTCSRRRTRYRVHDLGHDLSAPGYRGVGRNDRFASCARRCLLFSPTRIRRC